MFYVCLKWYANDYCVIFLRALSGVRAVCVPIVAVSLTHLNGLFGFSSLSRYFFLIVCVCVEIQIWFLIIFFSCYLCAHIFLPHSSEPLSWLILMDWARTTAPHKNRQRDGNDDLPHENRIKHSKDTHSLRHRFLLLLGISADLPCTIGIVNVNGHEYYFAQMMHKKKTPCICDALIWLKSNTTAILRATTLCLPDNQPSSFPAHTHTHTMWVCRAQ